MLSWLLAASLVSPRPQTLLVAYVGHQGPTTQRQQQHVRSAWRMMQVEYPRWRLRCLLATGGGASSPGAGVYVDRGPDSCSDYSVSTPHGQEDLQRGHLVHSLLLWLGSGGSSSGSSVPAYDFLLKAELSTLVCFSMLTDLLEAVQLRFGGDGSRAYVGQIETCTRVQHTGLVRRGDEKRDATFLADVLNRKDAACYPPYMQGFGYVLGGALVREIAEMASRGTLRICAY